MCEQAPERQLTIQERRTTQGDPEFQLGVLLVQGIGTQRPGETLVHWGDVLLKTIERATRKKTIEGGKGVVATVEIARPGDGPGKGRFEAAVLLRADDRTEPERWLLSECWWADTFPAPSYRELVSWSVRALPWSIATYIAVRYWQAYSREQDPTLAKRTLAIAKALGQLSVALVFAPVLVALLGLALLLGLLPIPQLRTAILAAQSKLTATVGDSFAFVESPVRAGLIRTCILDSLEQLKWPLKELERLKAPEQLKWLEPLKGLEQLKPRCKHTVIVAHSQGAAAVLDALGGMSEPGEKEASSHVVPDALVTFGAGTNQLASQKVLLGGLPETNPVSFALVVLLVAVGSLLWLYLEVLLQQTSLKDIPWAFLVAFLYYVVCLIVLAPFALLVKSKRWQPSDRVFDVMFIFFWLVGMFLFQWFLIQWHGGYYADLPRLPPILALSSLASFFGALKLILSNKMKTIVLAPVRKPPGLHRWVDLYASADPVPNGPTTTKDAGGHEFIQIWNLGSIFADHTAYWSNRDEFVLRIAKVCAETAESPWALPHEPSFEPGLVDDRAKWRVYLLRRARLVTGVTWLALGALLLSRNQASIPVMFNLPGWVPAAPVRFVFFAMFIASAMWATSSVLRWLWNFWVRAEQEEVLAHNRPGSESSTVAIFVGAIFFMGMVVWMLIAATLTAATYTLRAELEFNLTDAVKYLLVYPFYFALASTFVLSELKGAPSSRSRSVP